MSIPDVPIEAVTWRVAAWAPTPPLEIPPLVSGEGGTVEPGSRRPVWFTRGAPPVDTPVYERASLRSGDVIDGPAVVQERETTIVLRPRWLAAVTDDGSIVATREMV